MVTTAKRQKINVTLEGGRIATFDSDSWRRDDWVVPKDDKGNVVGNGQPIALGSILVVFDPDSKNDDGSLDVIAEFRSWVSFELV